MDDEFLRSIEGGESNTDFNLAGQLKMGYSHAFSDDLRVQLAGFYRQFAFSSVRGSDIKTLPYMAGAEIAVQVAL